MDHRLKTVVVAVSTALIGFNIQAQTPDAAGGGRAVEEIVVVSKRGDTVSVQDMSEAVTAFSGDSLERQFAVTLEDFNHAIPNVQLEHVGLFQAAAAFSARGIGAAGIESFADPVVAVFVDDVYYARNATALLHLIDIESVQMLRGPQGTLYGRNAFAGALSVRTKRPDTEAFSTSLTADFGNAGRQNYSLILNAPIEEDVLAFRVAAKYHELEGFFRNDGVVIDSFTPRTATTPPVLVTRIDPSIQGDRENGERSVYIRPSLRYTPNEMLKFDLIAEYWEDKGDGTGNWTQCYQPGSLPPPLGNGPSGNPAVHQFLGFPCKDPFGDERFNIPGDNSNPFTIGFNLSPNQTNQKVRAYTLDSSADFDAGTLTWVVGYQEVDEDITTDTDGYNWDLFSSTRLQEYESLQTEVRWAMTVNDNVDLLFGGFLLEDSYQVQQFLWIFLDSSLFGGRGFTRDNPNVSWGTNTQERFSGAVYAQADWHITDQWSVKAGGRWTYEEKDRVIGMAINDSNCPPNTTPQTAACNGVPFIGADITDVTDIDPSVLFGPVDETWKAFSPSLGVEYKPTEDIMLFGGWQRAHKSGGFVNNAGTRPVFESPYDQEQVDNFEIGIRSEWFDNRLRLNANVFYAEYEDLQRGVIRAAPTSTGQETFIDNAAGAEAYGVELDFSLVPIEGLTFYGNIGWLDIEYVDFIADLTGSGTPTDNSDLELVRAPEWDLNIGLTYDFPETPFGNFNAGVDYGYSDEMVLTVPNDVGFDRRPLDIVNAQLNWESENERYKISLWGKNLTDDIERLGGTPVATLFAFATPTQPRQYGITLTANFDR